MKHRATEILFRHIVLLALPFVVIVPLTVLYTLHTRRAQWESVASAWVTQPSPIYTEDRLGSTPAPNQASLLQSLLTTRTFATAVLRQTPLASQLDGGAKENAAIARLQKAITVSPTGNEIVTVRVRGDTPDLAYAIAQAVLTTFADQVAQESTAVAQTSVALQENAYNKANAQYTASLNALASYIAQHPELADPSKPLPPNTDPTYERLLAQANSDQQAYNEAKLRYEQAKQQAQAGSTALPYTFSVIDPPRKPVEPVPVKKTTLLKLPLIGLAFALMLSGLTAAYLVLSDRRIFTAADLREATGLAVLGTLPDLAARWRREPRDLVRARIAAPARVEQMFRPPLPETPRAMAMRTPAAAAPPAHPAPPATTAAPAAARNGTAPRVATTSASASSLNDLIASLRRLDSTRAERQ